MVGWGFEPRQFYFVFSLVQSCLTLCDPMDCSSPGSAVHGIFQARILEWGAIAFSSDKPDSILKRRDIALLTNIHLVESRLCPVVM